MLDWFYTLIPLYMLVGLAVLLVVCVITLLLARRSAAQLKVDLQLCKQQAEQDEVHHQALQQAQHQQYDLKLEQTQQATSGYQSRVSDLEAQLKTAQAEGQRLAVKEAEANTALTQERIAAADKIKLLEDARLTLTKEFENLANRIFEEKTEKFGKLSKEKLDATVTPLREQLSDFKRKVEDVYDKESKQRQSLLSEIGQLKSLNNRVSEEALNLTRALKGEAKTQGNWGEVVLERVLEQSGLRKGYEYQVQVAIKSETGRNIPDVIVRLPEEKDIVIDAKVSLTAYERYCSAEDDEKLSHLSDHVNSVKGHIKNLADKAYHDLVGLRSLDFVLLFIPIEAAFLTAFEADPELFSAAYDKNIIVVSPTTLLATLRTIHSIWRYERQNKNAEEIAAVAGRLHDQIALVAESIEDIGKHLGKADKAQVKAVERLSSGRGNLINRAESLRALGAKTKKSLAAYTDETNQITNEE